MSEKKGKLIVGEWNTKTIVAVAIGAALYGVLMDFGSIQVFTNTSLTTAMIVPVLIGGLYGAVPACVAAGVGNVLADLIGGWGMWFDWSVGNAVMAFCVGLLPVYGAKIRDGIFTVKHALIYALCCVLGNAIAFGLVTPILTALFYGSDLDITFLQAIAASVSNIIVLVVIGIPILVVLSKRFAAKSNLKEDKGTEY